MEVRRSGEKICQAQCGCIQERFSNLEKNGAVSDRFGLRMQVIWGKMVLTTYINVFLAVLFHLVVHPTPPPKPKLENLAVRPTLPPKQSSRCLHAQPAVLVGLKLHRKKGLALISASQCFDELTYPIACREGSSHTGGKGWCPDPVHHKYIARKWTKDLANTHPEYSKDIQNFPSQFN
jgi:hypothetical protein